MLQRRTGTHDASHVRHRPVACCWGDGSPNEDPIDECFYHAVMPGIAMATLVEADMATAPGQHNVYDTG